MAIQLSTGAIKEMLKSKDIDCPILQVLNTKPINGDRHRLFLNDGDYSTGACMIAVQLNPMIVNNEVDRNCIVKVTRYICNTVKGTKRVLVILDMEIIKSGNEVGDKIGNPVNLSGSEEFEKESTSVAPTPLVSFNQSTNGAKNNSPMKANKSVPGVHPIASLTPYQNKWTIRARVTNKSDIRRWSNTRGEGKLFSVDLLDESGEIRATAFNDQCDKYMEFLEIDKIYYITQAQLKMANKKFSNLKNDYEMTFNQGTQITPCEDETNIPTLQYEFKTIDQIESLDKDHIVDVIGICKSYESVATIIVKSTQKELMKRDIQIVDDSGKEIRVTLWGSTAESFVGDQNPIIAAKGLKVSDFNGKSLSCLSSSTVQYNPDITESHKLRAWYENTGCNMDTVNLSNQKTGSFGESSKNFKNIGEAIQENLGGSGNPEYYTTMAYVTFIRKENCMYSACPSEQCNKKVIDMNNGVYRCEKCDKEYDSFNWRLMVSASVADATGSVWVMLFQDQAEVLLGHTAAELGSLRETDVDAFQKVLFDSCFKPFTYNLRVKLETYNEESRLKTVVSSVKPVDRDAYNDYLIADIKKMKGIS